MEITKENWQIFLQSFGAAIGFSAGAGILGLALGFGLYMLQHTEKHVCSLVVSVFVYLVKNTPIPMFLFLLYYMVWKDKGLFSGVIIIIGFSIYFSIKVLALFQDSATTIKGQEEAAVALGYTRQKAFFRIIVRQVMEDMLPALKKEYFSLVKFTSIVGFLVVADLAEWIENIRNHANEVIYPLGVVVVIYYLVSWLISFLFSLKKSIAK